MAADKEIKKSAFGALLDDDDDYGSVTKSKATEKADKSTDNKGGNSDTGDKDVKDQKEPENKEEKVEVAKAPKKVAKRSKAKKNEFISGSEDEKKLLFEHGNEMEYGVFQEDTNEMLQQLIGTKWPGEIVGNNVINMRVGRRNNKWIKALADEFEISDTQVLANILGMFRIKYKDFIKEVLENRSKIEL